MNFCLGGREVQLRLRLRLRVQGSWVFGERVVAVFWWALQVFLDCDLLKVVVWGVLLRVLYDCLNRYLYHGQLYMR